jgi:hypothetical protein
MKASYEKLNYRLRPAKHIERGMIVETLQRLRMFAPLRRYRYVGLGSLYFADFILVHRALGIRSMVCVEKDEPRRERFRFNRPFRTVTLRFGHSNDVLPAIGWTQRTIVWLDYDCRLSGEVLTDIRWVCGAAPSGSVIIVSVNAEPLADGKRIDGFRKAVGARNVPQGVTKEGHLAGWLLAGHGRTVIDSVIRETVQDRSVASARVDYRQVFNFEYRDGARMSTVGGIVVGEEDRDGFEACEFDDLDYVRTGAEACRIEVPFLTNREIRLLDRQLPTTPSEHMIKMLPEDAQKAYQATYRFFPTFVDAEF